MLNLVKAVAHAWSARVAANAHANFNLGDPVDASDDLHLLVG